MKKKIGLVQINNSFSGQNYFPYSIGLLQAYALKNSKNIKKFEFLLPIYKRISISDALVQLNGSNIVVFSTYVWNIRLSIKIAEKLKTANPDTIIMFGGPQVPDKPEFFLKDNPFIDIVCMKEGEEAFSSFLDNYDKEQWNNIPSVAFINSNGEYIENAWAERIKELSEVPSPYLEGIFDPLMEAYPDEQWLVMWETNRGCPFACTFCDWGSATQSKVNRFDMDRLVKEIDWFRDKKIEFIFCCDANFGILPRDIEIVEYAGKTKQKYGYPQALSVQNTKNAKERAYKVQKLLSDYKLNKGVTLALQSLDEETLKHVKRDNISLDAYKELQERFTREKVATYTDMILGMPGETYDSFLDGISTCIENGQHNRIQFGNLSILPNAEMGDPAYQKKYGMEIIESNIINIHGSLSHEEEVQEVQQLVISTKDMPREDWQRVRVICWMTAILHFNKLLQIPLLVLHKICDISFREMISAFTKIDKGSMPILFQIYEFFISEAKSIQNGGPEYCKSPKFLNIWWPADELQMIKLFNDSNIDQFYMESELLIKNLLLENNIDLDEILIHQLFILNKELMKKPFINKNKILTLDYNIIEVYRGYLFGLDIQLDETECTYIIDRETSSWKTWDSWCKEVVWYGNKKGAYMYDVNNTKTNNTNSTNDPQNIGHAIEGHY